MGIKVPVYKMVLLSIKLKQLFEYNYIDILQ